MRNIVNILNFCRKLSTTSYLLQPRSLVKMKKIQADFQCEDGRPIHLKGGFGDRVLYSTTLVACALGLLMTFLTIYDFAKPASWRNPC